MTARPAVPSRWLIVCAAPREARAVADGFGRTGGPPAARWATTPIGRDVDLVLSGVGKACAAAALAHAFKPDHHTAVLNLGVAGALPGSGLAVGDLIAADRSVYADEGVATPAGFTDIASLGFPPGPPELGVSCPADPDLLRGLAPLCTRAAAIATVSACSGTDAAAAAIAERTSAAAEAMEGAALAFTLAGLRGALGCPAGFIEVRAISNFTGDRANQRWDLQRALESLTRFAGALAQFRAGR